MPKYIFVNGVMKLDPNYKAPTASQDQPSNAVTNPQALTVISSTTDIQEASAAQEKAMGKPMQVSEATQSSMEIMLDPDYANQFKAKNRDGSPAALEGGYLLDALSNIFARYEVPIGLINKLLALTEYNLNFLIDDSGSMTTPSDLLITQACPQVRQARDPHQQRARSNGDEKYLTRWEEAEDRIHILIDMLAYIPIENLKISFFNNTPGNLFLSHTGKTPQQFADDAHEKIKQSFNYLPIKKTPLYGILENSFRSTGKTMHYVFTDGEPSDRTIDEVKLLIKNRAHPEMNPLSLMSCTNNDDESKWMKEIEEDAPYTSELDDFVSEQKEVLGDQGQAFPFTRGFWLICQLVAAINPYDLDAMDESVPFTKKTMNDLLGRNLTIQEYQHYFNNNPHAAKYRHQQREFEREDILAHHIVKPQGSMQSHQPTPQTAGYPNQPAAPYGGHPGNPYPPQPIAPYTGYPNQQPGVAPTGYPPQTAQPGYPNQKPVVPPTGYPPTHTAGNQPGYPTQQPGVPPTGYPQAGAPSQYPGTFFNPQMPGQYPQQQYPGAQQPSPQPANNYYKH